MKYSEECVCFNRVLSELYGCFGRLITLRPDERLESALDIISVIRLCHFTTIFLLRNYIINIYKYENK